MWSDSARAPRSDRRRGATRPPARGTRETATTARTLAATNAEVEGVRLGPVAFGSNPTFVATAPNERWIAASMGMAGAEVELFDAHARRIASRHVDLERAVRALDFSVDGATVLVSLTGGTSHAALLELVSAVDGKVLRTIELPTDPARGSFERGPEGRFLADGSIVARAGGRLVVWSPDGSKRSELDSLPRGAFLSTSPDKRSLVVSTPDEVSRRDIAALERVVVRRRRVGPSGGATADPRAYGSDDGALVFQDRGEVVLRSKSNAETSLGSGAALGLGARYVIVAATKTGSTLIIPRANASSRTTVAAPRAWLAPREPRLVSRRAPSLRDGGRRLSMDRPWLRGTLAQRICRARGRSFDGTGARARQRSRRQPRHRETSGSRKRGSVTPTCSGPCPPRPGESCWFGRDRSPPSVAVS